MARKREGSHRAYREWAPSVKLLGQNIIEIKSIIISTQLNNKTIVVANFLGYKLY